MGGQRGELTAPLLGGRLVVTVQDNGVAAGAALRHPVHGVGVDLRGEATVPEPAEYAGIVERSGRAVDVDVWETTYLHRLTGADPVLTWISATALRPVRDALDEAEYAAFRAELAPRLRAAYPVRPDGTTWLPFRRIFAVARVS